MKQFILTEKKNYGIVAVVPINQDRVFCSFVFFVRIEI